MSGTVRALVCVAVVFGAASSVRAATITAASCNAGDVQAALSRAAAGDTVVIPAGTCHWTSGFYWTAPPNVTVRGAGSVTTLGGGDATIIIDDYQNTSSLIHITTSSQGSFRLAGLSLRGGSINVDNTKYNGLITVDGSSRQMRIDHVTCNLRTYSPATPGRCFQFGGWVYGVVDHSVFELPNNTGQAMLFAHDAYGGVTDGDGAWAADTALGTGEFIFVEDNTFTSLAGSGTAQDCNGGGRFVWRYNTMVSAGLQTHPTGGAGRGRGCRAWEIYGNKFDGATDPPVYNIFFLSSGTGVIWGNTVASAGYKNFVTVHSMRKDNNTYSEAPPPDGWGYCGSTFNGTASNWDGKTDGSSGYPCLDQPGRGKGDLLSGSFPNVVNKATGCSSSSPCAWPRQALEPVYEWSNTFTPAPGYNGSLWAVSEASVLAANRDYYLSTGSFNATSGLGRGPIASRPATCTPGVAYWATDEGEWNASNGSTPDGRLYRCSSTNTWTLYYTPYTYPHPLTAPSAATNIRVR